MDIIELISIAVKKNATDLNLVVDNPPLIRVIGNLMPIEEMPPLTSDDVDEAIRQLATPRELELFQNNLELDFGYTVTGVSRLRCNAAQEIKGASLAIRLLPEKVPTIDELGLPKVYKELVNAPRGLLMVCGPTDSGKSTTLAAMVNELNNTGGRHIITIEDPIEYVHQRINCAITQRQLGIHTQSYPAALRHLLRQHPDVVLVGEIRDPDTAAAVIAVAETGHLVMTTSHAPSATQAVERIVDMFTMAERDLTYARLASLLVAIICQVLVPKADKSGRIAAVEILMATAPVQNLIRDGKMYQLPNIIRTQRQTGMVSLDESLVELYRSRTINRDTLMAYCNDDAEVIRMISPAARSKKS